MKAKQQEKSAADAEASLAEGQKFLDENAKKEGVVVTESGIQYKVLVEGEGEKPAATDTVKVHYKGTFLNGEEFDSSKKHGQPLEFIIGSGMVIPGFEKGVEGMEVGEEKEFTIEPADAYGERNEDLKKEIPKSQLPEGPEPQVGMALTGHVRQNLPCQRKWLWNLAL